MVRYSRLLASILKNMSLHVKISIGGQIIVNPHGKSLQICIHLCHLILQKHGNMKQSHVFCHKTKRSPGQNVEPIAFIFILAVFKKRVAFLTLLYSSPIGPGWTKIQTIKQIDSVFHPGETTNITKITTRSEICHPDIWWWQWWHISDLMSLFTQKPGCFQEYGKPRKTLNIFKKLDGCLKRKSSQIHDRMARPCLWNLALRWFRHLVYVAKFIWLGFLSKM